MDFAKLKTKPQTGNPLERLIFFSEAMGMKVLLDYKFDRAWAGEVSYNEAIIKIAQMDERQQLLTLAHEAGHALSNFRVAHNGLQFSSFEREFFAYLYGWRIIRWLKIDEISKNDWKTFHKNELQAYEKFKERT